MFDKALNAPLFLVLAEVCAKIFIKKEVICLVLDNIFFSITQPSKSVNMMLSVGKTDMGMTP